MGFLQRETKSQVTLRNTKHSNMSKLPDVRKNKPLDMLIYAMHIGFISRILTNLLKLLNVELWLYHGKRGGESQNYPPLRRDDD